MQEFPGVSNIGSQLRDAREGAGLSLTELARLTHYSKGYLSNVETGVRTATPGVLKAYEQAIGGTDVFRRRDITHPDAAKIRDAKELAELASQIEEGRPGILGRVPTSRSMDFRVVRRLTPDGIAQLRPWMADERGSMVLRTNALSILAKAPGRENALAVADTFENNAEVRQLCVAFQVSRVLQLDWQRALEVAADLPSCPNSGLLAKRLAREEVTDSRDAGVRWCGAYILGKLAPVLGR